jgi:DNA-binding transcriptional MerR regulator
MEKSPDAFRTISEVAELLETPPHVLRFWESRFPQIRPVKRAGGRRYYRPVDVALLIGIRRLLHDEGITIRGVQKILREHGVRHVSGVADDAADQVDAAGGEAGSQPSGQPNPSPETRSAQIVALRRTEGARESADAVVPAADSAGTGPEHTVPEDEDDLFARLNQMSAPQDDAAPTTPDTGGTSEPTDTQTGATERAPNESSPDADEAPMQVWAEPAAAQTVRATMLTMPRPRPDTDVDGTLPPIARRLRATRAADLSQSDRARLTVLRAKARSLRDRLDSQHRSGG